MYGPAAGRFGLRACVHCDRNKNTTQHLQNTDHFFPQFLSRIIFKYKSTLDDEV